MGTLSQCYSTYSNHVASPFLTELNLESNSAALPIATTPTMAPNSTTRVNSALPSTTTTTMAPNSTTPLNSGVLAGKARAVVEQFASYRRHGHGYPDACGSDFIRYQPWVSSLQACQNMCSDEYSCRFVAYSRVGEQGCGLYKSQCHGQTHTTCSFSECFETYEKEQYWLYGAGYPGSCGSDYIRNEVNVASVQDCLGLCSAESQCHFAAYNRFGDRRCGLYKSSCDGQEKAGCNFLSQCYKTYAKSAQ